MKWPQDLKVKGVYSPDNSDNSGVYSIGFGYEKMPTQEGHLTDYREYAVTKSEPQGIVYLPLPAQLEEGSNHVWNLTKSISSQMKGKLESFATSAVDVATFGSASTYKDAVGLHLDPNFFYTYQHSEPRSFSYSINMIPKNSNEAETILEIIKTFKKYSSPIKGDHFVQNYKWVIEIGNKKLAEATKFGINPWVLVGVNTNYTGGGSALFFEDGMPKQINLSLTFNEMKTMHDEDWGKI